MGIQDEFEIREQREKLGKELAEIRNCKDAVSA
jgi:hypothetical protein